MECQTFPLVRNKLTDEKYLTNVNTYTFGNLTNTVHIDLKKTCPYLDKNYQLDQLSNEKI